MQSRYEFVIHGRLDREVVPALSAFTRTADGDFVVLRGNLDPAGGLADVLATFAELGLGLHSFRQVPDDDADGPGASLGQ